MAIPRIKINDPQPLDCPTCKTKEGYMYSDAFYMHYTSFHTAGGKYEGGQYDDKSKTQNRATTAYCCNCGAKLPFKLERLPFEDLTT